MDKYIRILESYIKDVKEKNHEVKTEKDMQ